MNLTFDVDGFLKSLAADCDVKNKVAVFDADGTLWKDDVGFGFFNYQIKNNLIENQNQIDDVHRLYQTHPSKTCSLILQVNKNISYQKYISWIQDYLQKNKIHVFSFQRKIINYLKSKEIQICVVTASPCWVVEETIQRYKLPVDHVIGIKTHIQNGRITDQLIYPLSIGPGKLEAFLKQSKGISPFFAAGNTLSDLEILKSSTHFKFVVASAPPDHRQYYSERALMKIAQKNSWNFCDLVDS